MTDKEQDKCPDMVKIAKSNAVGMGLIPPDSPDREKFLVDLRLLEEHKTSPEWIAMKYMALIEPLIEEAKQVAFGKGVKRGTTIRNIDWNSENHKRHGAKMVKAREEAKTQEKERIIDAINDYTAEKISFERCAEILDINYYELVEFCRKRLQALKETK